MCVHTIFGSDLLLLYSSVPPVISTLRANALKARAVGILYTRTACSWYAKRPGWLGADKAYTAVAKLLRGRFKRIMAAALCKAVVCASMLVGVNLGG